MTLRTSPSSGSRAWLKRKWNPSAIEAELIRQELKALRDRNLRESTFEDRADLVAKLGIKILPSEDLKSRKIFCQLNLAEVNEEREQSGFAKMTFGGPKGIRPRVPLPIL
jgi:hypothetical protein